MIFEQISQRIDEPIILYYLRKAEALYTTVQEPCTESFTYFKDHAIRGIYAPHIRQKVIEDTVNTHEELRHSMAKHVANALKGYEMKTGAISSLDGLSVTTELKMREKTTGIKSIQIKEFKGPCWTCGEEGHRAVDCDEGELCWVCKQEGHKAIDCVKKISRYPQQETMRVLRKFSPKHLPIKQVMGHERGPDPRACRQEHEMPIGKEKGYTSNYNGFFPLKKRRHRSQERTTSIKTRNHRVPTQEGSPNGVKYGLYNSKTHYIYKGSEQRRCKRMSRIREGRPSEVRERSRTHGVSEEKEEVVEKEARNRKKSEGIEGIEGEGKLPRLHRISKGQFYIKL